MGSNVLLITQIAEELQRDFARNIEVYPLPSFPPSTVGAIDVSYKGEEGFASYVITDMEGKVLHIENLSLSSFFPYIPEFLFLMEAPFVIDIFKKTNFIPDVLLLNGHGLAHPRNCGLSTFIGILLRQPTIGVATSLLKNTRSNLYRCVSSKSGKKLYISIGNLITLDQAFTIVSKLMGKKLPLPLEYADRFSRMFSRGLEVEETDL